MSTEKGLSEVSQLSNGKRVLAISPRRLPSTTALTAWWLYIFLLTTVAPARSEDLRTIQGQIFIRTRGGEAIKLSLVPVSLFNEKSIADNLDSKHKAALPIDEYLNP